MYNISADKLLPLKNETEIEILFSNLEHFQNYSQEEGWLAFAVVFESTNSKTDRLKYKIRTFKELLRNKDTRIVYDKEYKIPDVTTEGSVDIYEYVYPCILGAWRTAYLQV